MIKRVLFVASLYKPNIGGIETAIEELSKEYKRNGIISTVLTKQYPFDLPPYDVDNGVKIIRVKRPHTDDEYISTLKELLKNEELKADIIHVIGVRRPLPLFALFLAKYYDIPVIMTFAGDDVIHNETNIHIWKEYEDDTRSSIIQARNYISYSKGITQAVDTLFPKLGHIKTIYAGIDIDKINSIAPAKLNRKYIIVARRLVHDKGIDILIDAFASVLKHEPDLYLYIVGDGDEKENLQNQVRRLSIENQVIFTGGIPLEKLIAYLKGAIIHVCPSRIEGGGIVNIEASACGCVPIGSNVDGIPEYIHDNKTGLLFETENAKDLADKIILLLKNNKIRSQLKENGYLFAKKFDISVIAKEYLSFYEKSVPPKELKSWSTKSKKMCEVLNDSKKRTNPSNQE